jgi:DNA-binding MarR family transcriptional regulator
MTEPAKPQGCTNLKLRQLNRAVTRHYDAHVAATGLKNSQYSLLSHVVLLGPLRPGELARRIRMDASTLTRNLQPLVDRGLVQVTAGDDARSRLVSATPAGQALREEAKKVWKQAQLALNARLQPERVAALHDLIDECLACLDVPEDDDE